MPTATSSSADSTKEHALAVHRCRFVDFIPAAITAITFPPLGLPSCAKERRQSLKPEARRRFGPLVVGRTNGNIEILEWARPGYEQDREIQASQAWVLSKIFHGPNPSKVDSLALTLKYSDTHAYGEVPSLDELRLYSSGGGSELVEWDISCGTILVTLNSQGGAIWSMAVNPSNSLLALGCEDGCVRLVDIAAGGFAHARRFDRVKCRILSIAWGPPVLSSGAHAAYGSSEEEDNDEEWRDSFLITGGSDSSLRKWDVKTGRSIERMTVDKARGERTLVWAVGVLGDGTIVSGDFLGTVKFWDSRTCTQLHSFPAHGADILCLAIGPGGSCVLTSGVDQKICLFTHVRLSNGETVPGSILKPTFRWVQATSKRMHSHDVRALAVWPPYIPTGASHRTSLHSSNFAGVAPILASGGLDASLVLTPCASVIAGPNIINPLRTSIEPTFEDSYHRRVTYTTGLVPAVSVAGAARLLVCAKETSVCIWRILGRKRSSGVLENELRTDEAKDIDVKANLEEGVDDESGYEKLLDMELDTTTNICASAISDDGRWLAVSDTYEAKLFELLSGNEEGSLRPRRIKSFSALLGQHFGSVEGASTLGFAPDGGRLVLAGARCARVIVIDLTVRTDTGKLDPRVLRCFEHHTLRTTASGRVIKAIPAARTTVEKEFEGDEDPADDAEGVDDDAASEPEEQEKLSVLVTRLVFSPDGQWLATTDDRCRTHVFNLDSARHHTTLPTSPTRVAALAFMPPKSGSGAPFLLLAHVDAMIAVFDVEARRFPEWAAHLSQRSRLPQRWTGLHEKVLGIAIEPIKNTVPTEDGGGLNSAGYAIFWGATWLCRVAIDVPVGWGGFVKKRRRDEKPREDQATQVDETLKATDNAYREDEISNFRLVSRYRPILFVDFLGVGEIIVVERPLVDVLQTLPPAFFRPKYGT